MKTLYRILLTAAAVTVAVSASAQKSEDPQTYLTYSLPSTTIVLDVEAVQEVFYAGPYAKYAEKYLGIKPRLQDETSYQITQISMTPYIEADQNRRYSVNVTKGDIDATFLKLTSAGLISFADATFGEPSVWRFPTAGQENFADKGISSNLTSESTTLYRNDKKETTYNRVAVQQNMVVAKSEEKKAAEAAAMILRLREQKLQIVTGDTDATYSGEAMGAAIEELARLEEEYLTLFLGYSEYKTQKMKFDLIPEAGRESHKYIAFRLSDTSGLIPADNISGKPIVMEIVPQEFAASQVDDPKEKAKDKNKVKAYYRIPAMCTVKITDGVNLLLQSRLPIYQLGQESSLPVNIILK